MQYTYHMTLNFNFDSVTLKFLRYAYANFKIEFSRKCVGGKIFSIQIRIQRKILRRPVCVYMGSIVILLTICMNIVIAWVLNVSRYKRVKLIPYNTSNL